MISARIMRNEIGRKLGALVAVFAFILLSALLLASGAGLIVDLSGSLDGLFEQAATPHFVQMHTGEINPARIEAWGDAHNLVTNTQVVTMISVDSSSLVLPGSQAGETGSVMDIGIVTQSSRFDYLLDQDGAVARVESGTIGVPVYYAAERGVDKGDVVTLKTDGFSRDFAVGSIIRDSQMNPAIVHSKRFLVHPDDYRHLREHFPDTEYLIEFRLADPGRIDAFTADYEVSGLPSRGTVVDQQLFRLINGVSSGIVAMVVIILSLLLMLIAILCLRFTILATIEEDYREIGVMKAVGMPPKKIKGIYLLKYLVIGGAASIAGYVASRPVTGLLSENITRYIGQAPSGAFQVIVPLAAAGFVFLMVYLSARLVLRRFNRISAVEALRAAAESEAPRPGRAIPLHRAKLLNMNFVLGVRDALLRFRLFGLLTLVFFFATAFTLVPLHFLTTMRSSEFISYMGIGKSDIRIDLRQSGESAERFDDVVSRLAEDDEVERFAVMTTSTFTLHHDNGERESFAVETGNLTQFPLDYLRGAAPTAEDEIALSHLNSQELGKDLGDTLTLSANSGARRELRVVGIYQDITDGGRTAKALFPHNKDGILARTINVDLVSGVAKEEKVAEYGANLDDARVTDLEGYLSQTLGNTISQLGTVTGGALGLGLIVSILITSLFFRMLIAKDAQRIAIMRSIGSPQRAIKLQYLTSALLLLLIGIGGGVAFSNTLGQRLVSLIWSFMGAARIEFVINPLQAYVLLPLALMAAVAITTLSALSRIQDRPISTSLAG